MNKIPIFDSLAHPTINSDWIMPQYPKSAAFGRLLQEMEEANVRWAFVVGMQGIGDYEENDYIKTIKSHNNDSLYPIAFYHPENGSYNEIKKSLVSIKSKGYVGIKLHPRLSNFNPDKNTATIIKISNDIGLICMLCTYPYSNTSAYKMTPESLMEMLILTEGAKVMLMHSGAVRLLEYVEVARAFKNILLDLSFTFLKYSGSSIDIDIRYMFNNFDTRICLGSDFPQHSLVQLRDKFELLSENVPAQKLENIAYKNIFKFLDK